MSGFDLGSNVYEKVYPRPWVGGVVNWAARELAFFLRRIHRQWRHHGDQLHDRGSKLPGYSTHPLKDEFRMCHLSRGWVLRTMAPKRDLLGHIVKAPLVFAGDRSHERLVLAVRHEPRRLILNFVWDGIDDVVYDNVWLPVQRVLQREIQKRICSSENPSLMTCGTSRVT